MSGPDPDWNGLLAACLQSPNRVAWDRFVAATDPVLMGTLCARTDHETARDLCQSLYLKLVEDDCRRLRGFDPTMGVPLPVYLRVLAIRLHIDWMRGKDGPKRRQVPLETLAAVLQCAPEAIRRLSDREVREAVAKLPPHPRRAVNLLLEGLSVKETAHILGLTEGGAAALLWRARRELKALLAGGWSDPTPL